MKPKRATPLPAAAKNAPPPTDSPASSAARLAPDPVSPRQRRPRQVYEHDIVTTAAGSNRLSIFVDLVRAAGLTDLLRSVGPFTVFAPTDRAFDRVSRHDLDALMADQARLADVLGHHVVSGRVHAPQPESPRIATPLKGKDLTLTSRIDAYHVNEARLVQTNIRASNGVIHAIDKLLAL
jgi:uncharacterized surface protein with fasciclin (FAS1) repeats